jgi:hypothetical protein
MTFPTHFLNLIARSAAALSLAFVASHAGAAVIAQDGFQSYSTGALNGANGGSGWGGAWSATGNANVVDPAANLSGNRALALTGNANNAAVRTLASSFSGNSLFVSFLVQADRGTSIDRNDFMGLWLDLGTNNGGTNRPNIGIKGNQDSTTSTNDLFARTTGTNGSYAPGSNIDALDTYLVVGHLYRNAAGNYTNFDLWLNPTVDDFLSPDASFTGNAGISAIDRVGIRLANLDSGDRILIDNLRLSTTFQEATAIPEPGVLGLLGLGLAGLAFARRRNT